MSEPNEPNEANEPETTEALSLDAQELSECRGGTRQLFSSNLPKLSQYHLAVRPLNVKSLLDGFDVPVTRPLPFPDRIGPVADDGIGKVGGGIGWKDTIIRW